MQGHIYINCNVISWVWVIFFSSNPIVCLAEGALPLVLVDTYFCLELFKQELSGGRWDGKEQTGNSSRREEHLFTNHLTLLLNVNSNNKQQSLKNMKEGNFLTMHFHQSVKTTQWYNFLDPKYTCVSCQISPKALAKIIEFIFFLMGNIEILV